MAWTRSLRADLKRYSTPALLLLAVLTSVGLALLTSACFHVAQNGRHLAEFLVLAVIVGVVSGRHALSLKGTHTGSSTADWLVFLGVVALGPYVGAILAAVDMLLSSRRVKAKPALYFFNVSNNAISVFAAGTVLKLASGYFSSATTVKTAGHSILVFAIPLICLALTHYVLHTLGLAAMAYLTFGAGLRKTVWNKLPWDPMSYVATATTAGLVDFVANHYSLITAAVTLVLALPVPVLIYYTFKTYRDKLDEQDRHFHELTDINDSILEMLAMAIDAKDQTTHDHIQRVRLFARRMGEIVGLSHPEIEALKAGALLHDIGKIGVPAYILNKPGRLTEHEFEQMKMHTIIGADMLSNVNFRYPVVPIVRHHHERWDGKGYPDGLAGENIPITARILTLVDNYDALRSDRPYHKAMTPEETLDYIKQNAGRFFDPSLVETFLSIVDDLEAQAAGFTSPETRKVQSAQSEALKAASPAAGFDSSPKTNRAAAALHSIAETNQRVTALYDLARNLAGAFSLEDTTAILTNRLAKLIPFTTCAVYLFDSGRSEFEVVHAIGRDAGKFFKQRLPVSSGITGWVIQNRRPMYNTNAVLDLGFLDQDAAAEYKGIMVYPLVKNQEALGAIALYSVELDSYPSESVQIMESISQPLSDSIYNAMAFEQAQRAALTDPVTGLANMRAFTAHFEREVVRSRRSGTALSLLVADVNNLAAAASQFSLTEEELISALGARLKRRLRETDLIARHGSASYVMLLSDIGSNEAIEVLARVHEAIARAGGTPGVPPHSGLDLPGRGSPALGVGGSDPNRRPGVHPHSLLESVQPGPHGRSAADRADTGHLPRTGDRAGEAHSPRLAEFDNPAAERRRVSGPGTGQRTGPLSEQLGALSVTLGAATTPDDGEALVDLIQVARSRSLPVREGVTDFDFVSADDIPPQS